MTHLTIDNQQSALSYIIIPVYARHLTNGKIISVIFRISQQKQQKLSYFM